MIEKNLKEEKIKENIQKSINNKFEDYINLYMPMAKIEQQNGIK
jgi:hypothetical protein